MQLGAALECIHEFPHFEDLSQLARDVAPEWIEEALLATGTATIRKRRLPVEQVPWVVIGMAMFRNLPISDVVDQLDLAIPDPRSPTVAPSAVVQARDRLGEAPMEWLFHRCAEKWAHQSADRDRFRGLAVYGVDGTTMRVPDSKENRDYFGLGGQRARGGSGYPIVKIAALMALRSHLLVGASLGPYNNAEVGYAQDLWSKLPDDSVVILDKHYWGANILMPIALEGQDRHWLTRGKENFKGRRLKRLGPKDELFELDVTPYARRKARARGCELPKVWTVRVIRYRRKGFREQCVVTSLLDADKYPADELVRLYHERWEIELAYDEIKTEMLDGIPLRSQKISRIRQEIWGVLIAYNLVRLEMERVADEAKVPPTRISFVAAYRIICLQWLTLSVSSAGAIPRRLQQLRQNLRKLVLPPRRPQRRYPRAVKCNRVGYPRKRRTAKTKRSHFKGSK